MTMLPERPSNVPAARTRLIGREADVPALHELLLRADGRLVTCTGAGGCGKTSLALEVARDVATDFRDGVFLAELAGVQDGGWVPAAVAAVLGVEEGAGRPLTDCLMTYLESRRLLLMLDNCEHVVNACADFVDRLLSRCPGVRILATSREPLRIAGEQTWRVPSLKIPDLNHLQPAAELATVSAVQLFVERARAVSPEFELASHNAPAVARICNRLDGLPLALELAAALVRGLPVEQLAARLDDGLVIPTAGPRTAPTRHHTLRATLDWSYDLLTEAEAALFRRLAVFAGAWDLASASALATGDGAPPVLVLDLLLALIDKSLVVVEEWDGQAAYRYVEPVRQYALNRLHNHGELAATRKNHATHFLSFAETVAATWRERTLPTASLLRLEREHDNLRNALAWADEMAEVEFGLRIAGAMWHLWRIRGYLSEGLFWLSKLLPREPEVPREVRAKALLVGGNLAWASGDDRRAQQWLEQALDLYAAIGDDAATALVLLNLGDVAAARQSYSSARAQMDEALALARSAGNAFVAASIMHDLGEVNLYERAYAPARTCFEESAVLARRAGDEWSVARAVNALGRVAAAHGDPRQAAALAAEALGTLRERGSPREMAEAFEVMAVAASHNGQYERAARLLGAAEALRERVGAPRLALERAANEEMAAVVHIALGDRAFDTLRDEGLRMGADRAIEYALLQQPTASDEAPGAEDAGGDQLLTPRQREVVVLVARGLKNRDIAEVLVIAEGTADRHLSNILAKLCLPSRAALAAWAVEHGLFSKRQI